MERWVLFAVLAMLFAGITGVLAKLGLKGIAAETGLMVRTAMVFALVMAFSTLAVPRTEWRLLTRHNLAWLGVSALTTTLSWVFYYKAIAAGQVSTVALIDKASFLVAVLTAWLVLGEPVTPRALAGGLLIVAGVVVVSMK